MEFNSPELQRFEQELEDAIETGIRQFNDELEESSLDETRLSIEEDLKNAENASDDIQKLMLENNSKEDEVEDYNVKSLASMFGQFSQTKPSHQPVSRTISTERSLSVKQGLAMFGSTVQTKSSVATTVKRDPPRTVEVKVPEKHPKSFPEQKHVVTLFESNGVKKQQTRVPDTSTRDVYNDFIRDKYSKAHDGESKMSALLPPPERENPPKSSQREAQNSTFGNNIFTPIKSKESLAMRWANNERQQEPQLKSGREQISAEAIQPKPTTTFVDDATINARRKALVQSLKVRISKQVEEAPQKFGLNDDSSNSFHSDKMNELDIESCIESPNNTSFCSADSTSDLDSIMLQECVVISPINERSKEYNETDSARKQQRDSDSDSGQWELPVVSSFPKQQPSSPRLIRCKCYNQTVTCVITTYTLALALLQKLMIVMSPLVWCIFNWGKSMTLAYIANITYSFVLVSSIWRQIILYTVECYEEWTMLSRLSPSGIAVLLQWIANMDRGAAACLASLSLSMATEISTVSPRYNCPIAVLLWLFQVKPVESKRQSIALLVLVLLSICVDLDWILSTYAPEQLGEYSITYRIEQQESILQAITWYGVVTNLLMKLICLNFSLRSSRRGMFVRSTIWQRVQIFCIYEPEDDINEATRSKIIAIVWTEMFALASCFVSFFVIDSKGGSSALWQDGPRQLLSLQATLLYKGVTGVLLFLALLHHISLRDLLPGACCHTQETPADRGRRRITSTLRSSKKCIVVTKMTDFAIGVVLWVNLVHAHKDFTRDAPKDSIVLYALLSVTQVMSLIISPCLCAVVAWWVHSNRIKSSRGQHRHSAMLENTPASRREHRRPKSRAHRGDGVKGSSSDSVSSRRSSRRNVKSQYPSSNQHTSLEMEYDLTHDVGTSQNLFETRLSAASPPALQCHLSTTPSSSYQLDVDIVCTPKEFKANWANLPSGTVISCKVEKPSMPSLSDCHKHFQARGVYVIASGVIGQKTKLFIIAQRTRLQSPKPSTSPKEIVTRAYCEIAFDLQDKVMAAEIRCRDKADCAFFVAALGLKDLI